MHAVSRHIRANKQENVVTDRFGSSPEDSRITVAMLSDALDSVGLRHQAMHPRFDPVLPGIGAIGYARTAQFRPTQDVEPTHPYDGAIDFIDATAPGDVIVIATDASNASAFWGELFSAAAKGRGAVGMITDGNARDIQKIRDLGFPVYSRSHRPVDFKGRMVLAAEQVEIEFGGVRIAPGDLVAVDDDGAVVVPRSYESQVMDVARQRARAESTVLSELLAGSTLREVWTKHGIL
jgi:4-hydroxy-4-methyl-2-oxoglutarate aldolase